MSTIGLPPPASAAAAMAPAYRPLGSGPGGFGLLLFPRLLPRKGSEHQSGVTLGEIKACRLLRQSQALPGAELWEESLAITMSIKSKEGNCASQTISTTDPKCGPCTGLLGVSIQPKCNLVKTRGAPGLKQGANIHAQELSDGLA